MTETDNLEKTINKSGDDDNFGNISFSNIINKARKKFGDGAGFYVIGKFIECHFKKTDGSDNDLYNDLVLKCYDCAVKYGDVRAMYNMGFYYKNIDERKSLKYYMMGCEKNNTDCTDAVIDYYIINNQFDNAKKYMFHKLNNLQNIIGSDIDEFLNHGSYIELYDGLDKSKHTNILEYFTKSVQNKINKYFSNMTTNMCNSCYLVKDCGIFDDVEYCISCCPRESVNLIYDQYDHNNILGLDDLFDDDYDSDDDNE